MQTGDAAMKSGLAAVVSVGSAILFCTGIVAGNAEVNTVHLPPVVEFLPIEKLHDVFATPHLAALCRLPICVELLPTNLLEPLFASTFKDTSIAATPAGCRDGVYRADSPFNFFDYNYVIALTIGGGKILSADYDEVNRSGKGKQDDKEYAGEMEKSGTTPAIAYPIYEQRLLNTQDVMKVDAVTGATYSLYRFRIVAALALTTAKQGK
jgi:major membrane immunogen (membrane-anchored lipoprotein)